jgi:hypothetical protein
MFAVRDGRAAREPGSSEFRAAGDAYGRTRLTPSIRQLLRRYFRLF